MRLAFATLIAAMTLPTPAAAAALKDAIAADMPQLMTMYRDFHANPELSMQEVRTPAKAAAEMRKLGFQVTEKVGKTGLVAVMKNGPGPTLLLRADMDALPVVEQTGLPFASKITVKTAAGVETLIHYPVPLNEQAAFAAYPAPECPVAARAARELLSLPLHPGLTNADLQYVVAAVRMPVRRSPGGGGNATQDGSVVA